MKDFFKRNKSILVDLFVLAVVTTMAIALYMSFKDNLKGLTGLASIAVYALIEFGAAGLGPVIVMLIRKERFPSYGFVKKNMTLSLAIGLASIFVFLLLTYLIEGRVQWLPLRRISVTATSRRSSATAQCCRPAVDCSIVGILRGVHVDVCIEEDQCAGQDPESLA